MSIMSSPNTQNDSTDPEDDLEALLEASSRAFALKTQQRKAEASQTFEQGDDMIQFNQPAGFSKSDPKAKGKEKAAGEVTDR